MQTVKINPTQCADDQIGKLNDAPHPVVASDSRQGGPSRDTGTHQSTTPNMRANEAAALPSPRVVLSRGSIGVK